MKHAGQVSGAQFSADEQRILTCSDDGTTRLWNAANNQCVALFGHAGAITSALLNRDETLVLTASRDGTARLWDISLDDRMPLEERTLEFEVRSATTLGPDGQVRVLTTREWDDRREKLLQREIRSHLALTPSGTVRTLAPDDIGAKRRQLAGIRKSRREKEQMRAQ